MAIIFTPPYQPIGVGGHGGGAVATNKNAACCFFIRKTRPYPPCGFSFRTFLAAGGKKSTYKKSLNCNLSTVIKLMQQIALLILTYIQKNDIILLFMSKF